MNFQRITRSQAKKLFTDNKHIYLCPSNFYPGGMWNIECLIHPYKYWEHIRVLDGGKSPCDKIVHPEKECFNTWDEWQKWLNDLTSYTQEEKNKAWDSMYNEWAFYNTNSEMGYYAHYYILTG